ncbi:MAG: sulfide/dihydroorotate dehydrogenase-like FAD/NAD-binding protein [Victivallales bacterium]|nr:sulfide/dihydroorotate dehydrogenase-like FAD/NAD-binding protein [Victivallales bacterium]
MKPYTVLAKQQLSENVFQMRVYAPLVAAARKPGQFVLISVDEDYGERVPLTIADADASEGSITLVFQKVGYTTTKLSEFQVGDALAVVFGPLGRPTQIEKVGRVVCVGGGIGIAPLNPIAHALKNVGNHLTCILGGRTKSLVIMEDLMRSYADEVIVCTDDGSHGRKGVVTLPLKELCESATPPDLVIAIGPPIMMKFCVETVRPYNVPITVSLNTIMVDGTGMCGGCRVTVGGQTKFVCVDGPEFDGLQVDFDGMMKRLGSFKPQERRMMEHACHIMNVAEQSALANK